MMGMVAPEVVQAWSAPVEEEPVPDEIALPSEIVLPEDAPGLSRQQRAVLKVRRFIAQPYRSVITFDVFDTFLFRRCTAPDAVFERTFYHLPIAKTRPGLVEAFAQSRSTSEMRARQKNHEEMQVSEATIAEIYGRFPRHTLGLEDVTIEELVAAELRAEIDLCIANPDMLDLIREAQARPEPLRVGFISDTYWSAEQLTQLLKSCAPDLRFDFIYTSADQRTTKFATLFGKVMQGENYSGTEGIHIGDNAAADILGARAFGIPAVYYPQPHQPISHLLSRETLAAQLMRVQRPDFSHRLDQGFHLVRRSTLSKLPELSDEQRDGAAIFGPLMAGFQHFVKKQFEKITASGGKAALLFLARDGHMPYQLWKESQSIPAYYLEINRRIALVANLKNIKTLQDVFSSSRIIDESAVRAVLKADLPAVRQYFGKIPGGVIETSVFVRDLPNILDGVEAAYLSNMVREQLLGYLRVAIPDFDNYTDLIMVDLGYFGTIQKALRGAFTRSGLKHRLHGVYCATIDDCFVDLPEGDTASGYIDSSVITPHLRSALLRNIAILEQICSAPQGSAKEYDAGEVRREIEIRPWEQLAFCAELQNSIRLFARLFDETAEELRVDLTSDLQAMRDWSSVLLLRFLIFPSLEEQQRYGALKQDVNLGTYLLYDMANVDHVKRLQAAKGFSSTLTAEAPPMWLGASIAGMSAFSSCAYGLRAFGLSARPFVDDKVVASVPARIIKDGRGIAFSASCLLTPSGELRFRFAVLKRDMGGTIAFPLETSLSRGLIRNIAVQRGRNSDDAMKSTEVELLKVSEIKALHCRLDGGQFTALNSDAHLLLEIPNTTKEITVITLTIMPLPPSEVADELPESQAFCEDLRAIA